jgi:xanthine dehydrogenase YagR molybdenum-binding subunit
MTSTTQRIVGAPINRIDGPEKVTGTARYAYEQQVERVTYAYPVQSTIAKGKIVAIDTSAAFALSGVLAVLSHENAPRIKAPPERAELAVLQSDQVAYRGQLIALVVAETLEVARQGAESVRIRYEEQPHNVILHPDDPNLYKPEKVNAGFETDTAIGDVEAAMASAAITVDEIYTTPAYHNNPLEPHATIATWREDGLTLYDSNQGAHNVRDIVAGIFDLLPERIRVITPYVGGGFGSKGFPQPNVIITIMAAREVGRPVKFTLTRQQMFAVAGYRTPTIQRIRLGADREGQLTAVAHDTIEQTSTIQEFAEQTSITTRMMYQTPNILTTHRLARLDVPTPAWMRAPGEAPGMFALESAMDELAIAGHIDPVELRIRNEPELDPENGKPFSSRGLVECLRTGAQSFGWQGRDPQPRKRTSGRWLIGTGVASSTYPTRRRTANARIHVNGQGQYSVFIDATDIGNGARTVLTQIAAEELGVPMERVHLEIGDSSLPYAFLAGGSMGTGTWGTAIVDAARNLRALLQNTYKGRIPDAGCEAVGETGPNPYADRFSMHSFGAQFAEAHVNIDTGEVRIPRLLGVFGVGRIMNAKTARSQLIGGMVWGLSMALHEHSVIDQHSGDYVNHDFAEYHISTNADVGTIDVAWIDEDDPYINPLGAKGVGEIGIVGTAAAIANAVYHATGIRIRELPITLDKLLS